MKLVLPTNQNTKTKRDIMSDIGFQRHKGRWNIRQKELILPSISSDEFIPSPNSIIPMKLHLCSASVRLYCRHKNRNNHFITQILKSISDFKTAVVEGIEKSTATSPSRKLIFYVSIITQMLVVSVMTATYRSLSMESKINKNMR
jgi:hypothetical protein